MRRSYSRKGTTTTKSSRKREGRVESVHCKRYDLKVLLKAITKRNLHPAVEFGTPEGKEF